MMTPKRVRIELDSSLDARPIAIAPEALAAAGGATLDVATRNVKLTLDDRAIATGMFIRTPILALITVAYARYLDALRRARRLQLSVANSLRPIRQDLDSAMDESKVIQHRSPRAKVFHAHSSRICIRLP
jgi:hypothetical protein